MKYNAYDTVGRREELDVKGKIVEHKIHQEEFQFRVDAGLQIYKEVRKSRGDARNKVPVLSRNRGQSWQLVHH